MDELCWASGKALGICGTFLGSMAIEQVLLLLCFTEEHLCGINFNLEIADILKWQSIITPTYGSNLALVIAVVSINWGLDWVMACRADGQ